MTDHPCKGMTKRQVEVFEAIAINERPGAGRATIAALLKAGVIVRGADTVLRDALGDFQITNYEAPIHVHCQWCSWCAENVTEEPPK